MKNSGVRASFRHAVAGMAHVLRTQAHVQIQFLCITLTAMFLYVCDVSMPYVILVASAMALVLICEVLNTAVEVAVNMITTRFHPLAKIAKDVAGAAVFLASCYAVATALGVMFGEGPATLLRNAGDAGHYAHPNPVTLLLLLLGVSGLIIAHGKAREASATPQAV